MARAARKFNSKSFEEYWSKEHVDAGVRSGLLIQSTLEISRENYKEARVSDPEGGTDIMIYGTKRNRALPGDVVAVKLKQKKKWTFLQDKYDEYIRSHESIDSHDSTTRATEGTESHSRDLWSQGDNIPDRFYQRIGRVVHIVEKKHSRNFAGKLKMPEEANMNTARFIPVDPRLPRLRIPLKECPEEFIHNPLDMRETLFIASWINDWESMGEIKTKLGEANDIGPGKEKLLTKYGIDYADLCDQLHKPTPGASGGKANRQFVPFEEYWSFEDVTAGLKNGTLIKSALEINPKKYTEVHVTDPGGGKLIMIDGSLQSNARNRALPGDIVAVELLPKSEWRLRPKYTNSVDPPDKCYQRFGKVVYIIEERHSRACRGHLRMPEKKKHTNAQFSPVDHRLPRLHIPLKECPDDFKMRPKDFERTLFVAKIGDWPTGHGFANGKLLKHLGEPGDIGKQTEGMLMEYDIDYSEFSDQILECVPEAIPWQIPEEEYDYRKDLRQECIFTIDPPTAQDLDDALHCKQLGEGIYEVGVHIADVSYFVKEGTALDKTAAERATTVYLVHKVISMLPKRLCEDLCSLNTDGDKLAFSYIWKMKEDGEILHEWCGRTVIRSCVKLSYAHAQNFIDHPDKKFVKEEFPPITNGDIQQIAESVLNLYKIAVNLRKTRLRDNVKSVDPITLSYTLDSETGMPTGLAVVEIKDSNRLVEEFMLLTNIAVAKLIFDDKFEEYKDTALLRRHPAPKDVLLQDVKDQLQELGINIEGNTYGEIQESLQKYVGTGRYSQGRAQVLTNLISKPMNRALYFCPGAMDENKGVAAYRHFALDVPLYTHFTSPIRRYADLMVHRLLAATLGYTERIERSVESVEEQASRCNDKKNKAKCVHDWSNEIFFASYVKECGPLTEEGMVLNVLDHSFDVCLTRLGNVQRVYLDRLPVQQRQKSWRNETKQDQMVLTLSWEADADHPATNQRIKTFTPVTCVLEEGDMPLTIKTTIKRPEKQEPLNAGDDSDDDELDHFR